MAASAAQEPLRPSHWILIASAGMLAALGAFSLAFAAGAFLYQCLGRGASCEPENAQFWLFVQGTAYPVSVLTFLLTIWLVVRQIRLRQYRAG